MAGAVISMDKIYEFWHSQVHNEEKWAANVRLSRDGLLVVSRYFEKCWIFKREVILTFAVLLEKLLRAAGLFAGSIVLMRNFGDLMAV